MESETVDEDIGDMMQDVAVGGAEENKQEDTELMCLIDGRLPRVPKQVYGACCATDFRAAQRDACRTKDGKSCLEAVCQEGR